MPMGFDGYVFKRPLLGRKSVSVGLTVGNEKVRTLNKITLGRCAGTGNSLRKAERKVVMPSLYRPSGKCEARAKSS